MMIFLQLWISLAFRIVPLIMVRNRLNWGRTYSKDQKGGITMTLKKAITLFGYHQRSNLKARTVRSYQFLLKRVEAEFGERSFDSIGSDEIFQFLETLAEDHSKSTRRLRYAQLKAFFNFLIDKCNLNIMEEV
jgi:integrase